MIPQHPALIPPGPPEEPPRSREGLLVAMAALLGAAVVLGGLLAAPRLRDRITAGDETATADPVEQGPQPSTTSTTAPAPTPAPSIEPEADPEPEAGELQPDREPVESVPCPDRYDEVICRAADFVQQTRGQPFKTFPDIELLEDGPFGDALLEDLDRSEPEQREEEVLLKSLGLLPEDFDLFAAFRSFVQTGVAGFYDPETGRLAVRGREFDLYGQSILVHELVHAYDDQWFDLGRDAFEGDAEYGFAAVVEGNAGRVEELWRSRLSPGDQARLQQEEFGALSPEDLDRLLALPPVILNLQISPYEDGERYVSGLAREGGEAAVDQRLLVPPESSEQVLHPDGPPTALAVTTVPAPSAAGPILSEGTIGELLVGLWLGDRAGVGWGGDRYVVWEQGPEVCFAIDLAADTPGDLADMDDAARRWARDRPEDREVQPIEDDLLRVGGCY